MTDHRKRIERLTAYLAAVDRRIAEYEATAASTKQPLSRHFAEKLEEARREHARLAEHMQQLRVEDATHWNKTEPVAGGLLQGLLETCDEIGARIDAALAHLEEKG